MAQLVRQHPLQLLLIEAPQQPRGHADHGALGAASGGEGVGDVGFGDGDARLGHVGHGAQAVDHPVQLGGLLNGDLSRPHGPQRHGVRVPLHPKDQG